MSTVNIIEQFNATALVMTPDGAISDTLNCHRIFDNEEFGKLIFNQFSGRLGIGSLGACPDPASMIPDVHLSERITLGKEGLAKAFSAVFYLNRFHDYSIYPIYFGPPGHPYGKVTLNEIPSCSFPRCIQTDFKCKHF